ncbi:MAG: YHYH domain-containing protein [Kofleriaceae bacterium]
MRYVWLFAIAGLPSPGMTHPGGTDDNGCHVQSSTGIRHCHGDGTGPSAARNVAELAVEVGGSSLVRGERLTYQGSYHLQHDGTMLFMAGFGSETNPDRPIGGYLDLNLGAAWIDRTEVAVVMKAGLGAKVVLFRLNEHRRAYLKLGGFLDLVFVPGGKAFGLNLSLGLSL